MQSHNNELDCITHPTKIGYTVNIFCKCNLRFISIFSIKTIGYCNNFPTTLV